DGPLRPSRPEPRHAVLRQGTTDAREPRARDRPPAARRAAVGAAVWHPTVRGRRHVRRAGRRRPSMIALTRRYRFPAAHVVRHPELSDAENARIYGKCANPAGHGHDYGLEVTVAGEIDPASGQIVARDRLDALVAQRVLDRFGHSLLNDDPAFAQRVPTAEN